MFDFIAKVTPLIILFIIYTVSVITFLWSVTLKPVGEISDAYRITEQEMKAPAPAPKAELLARWLFSPGKLNKAHQVPELTCDHCHPAFERVPEKRCRACHRAQDFEKNSIPVLIDTHDFVKKVNCLKCHWEHKGTKASISVKFDEEGHKKFLTPKEFERCQGCHSKLGFETHPSMTKGGIDLCYQCHKATSWDDTTWNHTNIETLDFSAKGFTRLVTDYPSEVCASCHPKKFHGEKNQTEGYLTIKGYRGTFDCLICHDFSKKGEK